MDGDSCKEDVYPHQEWLDTQGLAIVEAGFDRAVSLAQILDFDDC